ncbi:MAG: YkgJ family cysteine cluster protein [Pseudomonadota bacterium]
MSNPCLRCGACCAFFRVSFYWSEAEPFLGGCVPPDLVEPLNAQRVVMRGTQCSPARCIALEGMVGESVSCGIYLQRPSPCRELEPWDAAGQPDEKCSRARAAHSLPPLKPTQGNPLHPETPWPYAA